MPETLNMEPNLELPIEKEQIHFDSKPTTRHFRFRLCRVKRPHGAE